MERPFEVAEGRTSVFALKGNPGAAWAGTFLQARESLLNEALSPETDNISAGVQPDGDFIVAYPFGGDEDHLGSLHFDQPFAAPASSSPPAAFEFSL